jgi:hypothetical protein
MTDFFKKYIRNQSVPHRKHFTSEVQEPTAMSTHFKLLSARISYVHIRLFQDTK